MDVLVDLFNLSRWCTLSEMFRPVQVATEFIAPSTNFATLLGGVDFGQTLPRKLASAPCAASLLSPLPPDEALKRQLQLQRIVDIAVLDATRDKKNQLVITLKLSLKPEMPSGIFVPSHSPVVYEATKSFHDVTQLNRVLNYCVDKATTEDCNEDCEFCAKLRAYLHTHWARDPFVTVMNIGHALLRKASLVMHLVQLVAMTIGAGVAVPTVKGAPGVQLVPKLWTNV